MFQWFIRFQFAECTEFMFRFGKTPLYIIPFFNLTTCDYEEKFFLDFLGLLKKIIRQELPHLTCNCFILVHSHFL